jgi:hypothetical protein
MQIIKTSDYTLDFSLYDFYKENGGNHSKLKSRFNTAIENLDEANRITMNFALSKMSNGGIGASSSIETIIMDKRTALWFSSKLDDNLRLKIIDKVSEPMQQLQVTSSSDKLLEGLLEQGRQTQQLLAMVIQQKEPINQETELDKQKKQLEIENLKIDKISKIAKLSKDYKLETIGDLTDVDSELTTNLKKLTGSVIKEVRPSVNGISPTEALKLVDLKITASELYKAMNKANVVDVYEQPKYLGGVTLKWEISDSGRYYGYNQHSSSVKKYPVQVKLYSDRFLELIQLLQINGYL